MPADDIESEVSTLADEGSTIPVDRSNEENDAEGASTETAADTNDSVSTGTEMQTESGVTNDTVPLSLAKFDVLQFKNSFLEIVEEVRMRRIIDAENEERIKQLVTENHDLQQKLEEECNRSSNLIEGHSHQENQLRKEYEDKLKQIEVEKAKNDLSLECWEQELKALKEEIRTLHLVKYTLEKTVQEQERQLHVQTSSRDSYLSKINQLEEECTSASSKSEGVMEQMERLEANVKGAQELHKKLEYVNEHQKCELEQYKKQLENCRGELTETRVELAALQGNEESRNIGEEHAARMRVTEQELRMQVEINKQVQSQLLRVREDHRTLLLQLKEAHTLIERHVESSARLGASEMLMQEELSSIRVKFEESEQKLLSSTTAYQSLKESFEKETEQLRTKYENVECRLKALQSDYNELQSSHNALNATNSATERDMKTKIEEMTADQEKSLKLAQEAAEQRKLSQEQRWREKVEQFRSALEQSEAWLAEKERSLQEKTKECFQLELQLREQRQHLNTAIVTNTSDLPLHHDAEQFAGDLKKPGNGLKEIEDDSRTAYFDDELSIQQIPELIISPDVLSSSPPRWHHKQEQILNQTEVIMCMSKMSESKKVSPKLCLQRLPLTLQMRPPIEKRAGSPLGLQNNEEILTSTKLSSGAERDLGMCESPRKKPRKECPDKVEDSVQLVEADTIKASVQESETKSITKQLKMITPEPSEQLIEIVQGEQSSETPLCNAKPIESVNVVTEVCSDKPDCGMIVEKESNVSSQQPALNDMDQQPLGSPIVSSDDGFELRDDEDEMVNTQISKQIDKVQVFLKMDRLRKTKKQ